VFAGRFLFVALEEHFSGRSMAIVLSDPLLYGAVHKIIDFSFAIFLLPHNSHEIFQQHDFPSIFFDAVPDLS